LPEQGDGRRLARTSKRRLNKKKIAKRGNREWLSPRMARKTRRWDTEGKLAGRG